MAYKVKVGYRFCGNCNPTRDNRQRLTALERNLADRAEFVFWQEGGQELMLLLNGCGAGCLKVEGEELPCVVISGDSCCHRRLPPEEVLPAAEEALRRELEELRRLP